MGTGNRVYTSKFLIRCFHLYGQRMPEMERRCLRLRIGGGTHLGLHTLDPIQQRLHRRIPVRLVAARPRRGQTEAGRRSGGGGGVMLGVQMPAGGDDRGSGGKRWWRG